MLVRFGVAELATSDVLQIGDHRLAQHHHLVMLLRKLAEIPGLECRLELRQHRLGQLTHVPQL